MQAEMKSTGNPTTNSNNGSSILSSMRLKDNQKLFSLLLRQPRKGS